MPRIKHKKGFTLFELILVMSIIGVIYTIMIQNFTLNDTSNKSVTLATIPEFLRENFAKNRTLVKFRCIDECLVCKVFEDGKETNTSVELFERRADINAYTLVYDEPEKIEFGEYMVDEYESKEICFEYTLYPNGSTDKMIVEYKDKVYLLDNYKQKTKLFERVDDASDFWNEQKEVVKER